MTEDNELLLRPKKQACRVQ
ncbi:hypothetical protein [Paenibacillus sp. AD87]